MRLQFSPLSNMTILTTNVMILRLLGLIRLDKSHALYRLHYFYCFLIYSLCVFCACDLLLVYGYDDWKNLYDFVDIFPASHIAATTWIKVSIFGIIGDRFRRELTSSANIFKNPQTCEKFIRKITICSSFLALLPVSFAVISPRVRYEGKLLPFHTGLSLDFEDTKCYILMYIYQFVGSFYVALLDIEIDLFLISLFIHCAHQLKLVQKDFREALEECEGMKYRNNRWAFGRFLFRENLKNYPLQRFHLKFRNSVRYHQYILRFISQMYSHCKLILLIDVISCLALFGISILHATRISNTALTAYIILRVMKLFFSTFYSEIMSFESTQIANALYTGELLNLSNRIQKNITLVIQMGQKSTSISFFGNKFGLNTFLWMLKASYSYYALLQQELDKKK